MTVSRVGERERGTARGGRGRKGGGEAARAKGNGWRNGEGRIAKRRGKMRFETRSTYSNRDVACQVGVGPSGCRCSGERVGESTLQR